MTILTYHTYLTHQQPTPRGLHQPPLPLPLLPPSVLRVYLSGCGHGVGIGLDEFNVITELAFGGAAARSGQLRLGDWVVGADGEALEANPNAEPES